MEQRAGADSPAAWRALAGCCIVALFGVSALYGSTFGLMMRPMQQELGWSRGDIAFSLTLMTLVGPAIMPAVGWVIDHVRLRPLVLWGVLLQSASLAAFGFMQGSVWVYYGLCLVMIITASGASMLTLAKLLQGWFDKAFGRALGILFAVVTLGAVIHPQLLRWVLENASWREGFMAMGALSLVFGGLAAFLLVHERPKELTVEKPVSRPSNAPVAPDAPAAQTPDAAVVSNPTSVISAAAPAPLASDATLPGTMRAFLRDRVWWLLALWNMLFAFAVGAIMLHFAALMQDRGLSLAQAATAMSVIGLGGFAGNLMAGWLIDRYPATTLARAFVLAPLLAAVLLYTGHGVLAAMVAAVMLGLFNAGDHSLSVFLARRYFSAETFGRASATQQIATAFGGGISPWLAGLVHDRTGSYDMALLVSIAAFVLACGAAWLLPENRSAPTPTLADPGAAGA
jgi:MFS transporter, OFA family, oxalate/formate antiporter